MPIIGKLVKKTTEFSAKRTVHKGLHFRYQLKVLRKIIKYASKTEFGQHYDFQDLILHENCIEEFQKRVPISDYDSFFEEWLHRSVEGEKNIAWPGAIKYFALSSGTTGSPSKRIPVTKQMIRSFQRTSIKQFTSTGMLNLSDGFYQKSFLAVGGSSKLEKIGKRIEGDLSGILKKHTSIVLSPITKPDTETAAIKNWNEKLERMVEMAPRWDISTIAGIPSWCIMLMEKIVERYQVETIHDIWPNLELYCFGGVYIEPYLARFQKVCGKKVHILNTYLASEGYFAYQVNPDDSGMKLILNAGTFFEFVPFDRAHFDERGTILPNAKTHTVNEVVAGIDYALVISTNAGLWRYMIGDLVQFTDVEKRLIKISGRIKQYLSLVGEHLSLDNINVAIQRTIEELNVSIPEFCLFADSKSLNHSWYFGTQTEINAELVMKTVDKHLCELNDDYKSVRNYDTLKIPKVTCIRTEDFYQFMEEKGKWGSQNKFPRVMTDNQATDWVSFLAKSKT